MRGRCLRSAVAWLGAIAWAISLPVRGIEPGAAPTVTAVELRSDARLTEPERVLELVALEPGSTFDEDRIRRTLRNLHATGRAAEIEVWSRPAPEGVVAVVVLRANVIVDEVVIEGGEGLRREARRREIAQKEGQPLVEDRILRSVYQLQDRYREQGYFEAVVRARVDIDEERRRARVVFEIDPGTRATVGSVEIRGEVAPFGEGRLLEVLPIEVGEGYRSSAVREAVERLRGWFLEQGHRLAEVDLVREEYVEDDAEVRVALDVRVGPKLELVVTGADRENLEKKGLLPFLGPEGYDEVLVLQSLERIERFFQEKGHWQAEVSRSEQRTEETLELEIKVEPGPLATLESVRFVGNDSVSVETLQGLMTTTPKRLLVPGSGRLVDAVLEEDLSNIRSYYALSGWTRTKVGPAAVNRLGESSLEIVVPIEEGPRARLVQLELSGVHFLDPETLERNLPLEPGGGYHPRLLEESLDRVRSAYERAGFGEAQVSGTESWNEERTLVDVAIRVSEGPRRVAGRLIVRGHQRTRPEIIREFADLDRGDPLSSRRLLEVQRNLYRLGVFSRVEVSVVPGGDREGERNVVIRVEEGRNRRLSYGVGYDSEEGFGGLFGYSHGNLWGTASRLQLDLRTSERTERYRLFLTRPRWGGEWPGSVTYLLFQEAEERTSFSVDRHGGRVEVARGPERSRYSLFFDYRLVDQEPAPGFDVGSLPPDEQRALRDIRIFSLIPRAVWDRRDDPLEPRSGSLSTIQLQYALPVGDVSDENFLKLFGQYALYVDLGAAGVVAGNVRMGGIEPLGDRSVAFAERFFAGGRTTHRAYERDLLGIPDETLDRDANPLGGNGLLLVNLDYRFPVVGNFGGVVFVDAGNVWSRWEDVDPREAKLGAGLGARYLSPIGPLRVEIGWKLDREPFESAFEVFVSFGNPF